MLRICSLVLAVCLAPVWSSAQAVQPADALARALETRYRGIRDFSADFVQTYRGGVLKTQTQERGTVAVMKPGRMRWVYTTPERKEFVSDGTKIYWYIPEDRQVTVRDVPPEDQATSPELFLSGKGDIARDFTASYVETSSPGTVALKLVPRRPEPQYEHLVVTLDPATMQIRGLTTRDRQGGESALTFTNMQENTGLSDNEFVFRIPRGVTVVTDDRR